MLICTDADVLLELLGGPSVAGVVGPEAGRRHDARYRLVSAGALLVTGPTHDATQPLPTNAMVTTTIRLRLDGRSTAYQKS